MGSIIHKAASVAFIGAVSIVSVSAFTYFDPFGLATKVGLK